MRAELLGSNPEIHARLARRDALTASPRLRPCPTVLSFDFYPDGLLDLDLPAEASSPSARGAYVRPVGVQ